VPFNIRAEAVRWGVWHFRRISLPHGAKVEFANRFMGIEARRAVGKDSQWASNGGGQHLFYQRALVRCTVPVNQVKRLKWEDASAKAGLHFEKLRYRKRIIGVRITFFRTVRFKGEGHGAAHWITNGSDSGAAGLSPFVKGLADIWKLSLWSPWRAV
jgi:hypothetical protein